MSSYDIVENNQKTDEEILKALNEIIDSVKNLYLYRDFYFENHKIEDADKRISSIKEELNKILLLFDEHKDCAIKYRAKCNYLKGYALNILPNHNKEAEELLSKAIKLDPKNIEAWNELGDCYCKSNNLTEAKNCFENALNYGKNKVSLRNLSILSRQVPANTPKEKIENIEKGLVLAKDAVQLDPQDGLSWAVLGNAYLSSYFGVSQNPNNLTLSRRAYNQADKDVIAKGTTDLHYNKAVLLKYEQEFSKALDSFDKAIQLDPLWEPAKLQGKMLLKYLNDVNELVATSGKMKAKKLQQLLKTIDESQLGPYGGGKYTSSTGISVNLNLLQLNDLKPGINQETVVLGKVVCSIHNEDVVPFTFCLVDKIGTCVVVTVYNLADGKGVIIGDSVAIPEPYVTNVDFKYHNNEYKFRLIRVENPLILVVNRRKVDMQLKAGVRLYLSKKFD